MTPRPPGAGGDAAGHRPADRIGTVEHPRRPGDLPVLVASPDAIRRDLGWSPGSPRSTPSSRRPGAGTSSTRGYAGRGGARGHASGDESSRGGISPAVPPSWDLARAPGPVPRSAVELVRAASGAAGAPAEEEPVPTRAANERVGGEVVDHVTAQPERPPISHNERASESLRQRTRCLSICDHLHSRCSRPSVLSTARGLLTPERAAGPTTRAAPDQKKARPCSSSHGGPT